MKRRMKYAFLVFWAVACSLALFVYAHWNVHANFLGIVETRTHKLGLPEPGRIQKLVALGDEVKASQVLAELETAELETEQRWIKGELERMDAQLDADRRRYALEYEKLRLQREASVSGISQRRADLEAKRAELQATNQEIESLSGAELAGLGRARDLSGLIVRRDALTRFIKEGESSFSPGAASATRGSDESSVVLSMLSKRLDQMSELKLRQKLLENQMERQKIRAPVDGRVVVLHYRAGDSVKQHEPILTLEESRIEFLDGFVPEAANANPQLNQRVRISPHRAGAKDTAGVIVFVDPGYSAVPERLGFRGVIYWARKFRVKLDEGHSLMPGEAAQVELLGTSGLVPAAEAKPAAMEQRAQ